jgi:glycine/D-amino acid oxidase-like deaminating enzyme
MRGQSLLVKGIAPRLPLYVGTLDIVPHEDGSALIGSTEEFGVSSRTPTLGGLSHLLDGITRYTQFSLDVEILEHRVGVRSAASDGLPTIGRVPHLEALWVLSGLWKNGIGLAPFLSQRLVQEISSGVRDPAIMPFDPERIVSGAS